MPREVISNGMVKLRYALLADNATQNDNGTLDIKGVFRVINAANFPARHPRMFFVVESTVDIDKTYNIRVEMINDKNEKVFGDFTAVAQANSKTLNVLLQVKDTVFEKPGKYSIRMFVDEVFLCDVDFILRKIDA